MPICALSVQSEIEQYQMIPLYRRLGQYRIILSADTASEVRQMLSQKRR